VICYVTYSKTLWEFVGERKVIARQPPIGGKEDYDSKNSWISDGLPSSSLSRRRRRGEGRGEGSEWREKWSVMEVDV